PSDSDGDRERERERDRERGSGSSDTSSSGGDSLLEIERQRERERERGRERQRHTQSRDSHSPSPMRIRRVNTGRHRSMLSQESDSLAALFAGAPGDIGDHPSSVYPSTLTVVNTTLGGDSTMSPGDSAPSRHNPSAAQSPQMATMSSLTELQRTLALPQ
ncbi:hypothetical protein KIPB_012327, partial [Kipferlia bialata]